MVDLEETLNSLVNENEKLINELDVYKMKVLPKFEYKDNVYAVNTTSKEVEKIAIDEVRINKHGVYYVVFKDETSEMVYPERFCFEDIKEAKKRLREFLMERID